MKFTSGNSLGLVLSVLESYLYALSIWILVILNSRSDHSKTSTKTQSGSDNGFVSSVCDVCLLSCLVIFCGKSGMTIQVKGTAVDKPSL